jgi:hypothetical protein
MTMFQNLRRMMTDSGSTLKLQCSACGHVRTWSQAEAFARYGPDATPTDVRRKSRCGECRVLGNVIAFI